MWSFLEVTLPSSWSSPSPVSSGVESAVPSLLGLQKTPRVTFMMSRLQNSLASNGILLYSLLKMFRNRYFKFTAIVCFWAGPETSAIAKLINRQRAPVRESGLRVMMMLMNRKEMMFLYSQFHNGVGQNNFEKREWQWWLLRKGDCSYHGIVLESTFSPKTWKDCSKVCNIKQVTGYQNQIMNHIHCCASLSVIWVIAEIHIWIYTEIIYVLGY